MAEVICPGIPASWLNAWGGSGRGHGGGFPHQTPLDHGANAGRGPRRRRGRSGRGAGRFLAGPGDARRSADCRTLG